MFLLLALFGLALADTIKEDGKELLMVQTIWRHGDRSPTSTYTTDYYREDFWTFGGGGYGELSPTGMKQHMNLGKRLRDRYIDGQYKGFLKNYYDSHEVYYRATDKNRTIISALSNVVGMWSQPNYNNRPDTDYPNNTAWPTGMIPIAIHNVPYSTDFILNALAPCDRFNRLWAMAKSSDEVQNFIKQNSGLLAYLTQQCGQPIDIDNLWIVHDAYFIEQIYAPDMLEKNPWYTPFLFSQVDSVLDQAELYQNGIFNGSLIINGIDIGQEIQKIKGGSVTNDVEMHMNIKMDCLRKKQTDGECKWINNMKFYVYSAHDATMFAFLSCFGIQSKVVTPKGYPRYSAALLIELWYDRAADIPYFKILYHDEEGAGFRSVTETIPECTTYCPLSVYHNYAQRVKAELPMDQWCLVEPQPPSSTGISGFTGILFIIFAIFQGL